MNAFDDAFLLERKEELISEQCLDNLFTKMNFDGLATDLAGIHEERCTSPNDYEALSSPATPLLTSWNYLDTIKEESVLFKDDAGCRHSRVSHRRVVSYDDVHRRLEARQEDPYAEAEEVPTPPKTFSCDRPLYPRQARHSLPLIYSDPSSSYMAPEKGSEFGYIEFPAFALFPRSLTEPPETSSPLHFIIENPAARTGSSPRRRHSHTPSPTLRCSVDSCDKTFSRLYNLHSHVKSHDVDRPFVCNSPDCSSSFARCHDLKRHEKTHSKDKPFNCAHCKRAFTRSDALTRHLRLGSCPLMMISR